MPTMSFSTERRSSEFEAVSEVVPPIEFNEFFHLNHGRLFAALCLTTGNRHEAEEIAQDAFLCVLERWQRVSTMDDPSGYLFTTAMNQFRKRFRRAKVAALLPMQRTVPDDVFSTIDDRDTVVRALRNLTPRQRAAIVLTAILDYPSEEAAEILRKGLHRPSPHSPGPHEHAIDDW